MKPYYEHGGITIYHGDCREVLPALAPGSVDLVLSDPPYGIDYDASTSSQRGITKFAQIAGDTEQFDAEPFLSFPDVLLWGANNFAHSLPQRSGQFYCWDKVCSNGMDVRIAECEFCWHKLGTKPRVFRHLWSGAYRASESGTTRLHPNQKPVALMKWCIQLSPREGTILDPFMGSGSTLRAAKDLGRRAIGIELSEEYCERAANRLRQEVLFPAEVA